MSKFVWICLYSSLVSTQWWNGWVAWQMLILVFETLPKVLKSSCSILWCITGSHCYSLGMRIAVTSSPTLDNINVSNFSHSHRCVELVMFRIFPCLSFIYIWWNGYSKLKTVQRLKLAFLFCFCQFTYFWVQIFHEIYDLKKYFLVVWGLSFYGIWFFSLVAEVTQAHSLWSQFLFQVFAPTGKNSKQRSKHSAQVTAGFI